MVGDVAARFGEVRPHGWGFGDPCNFSRRGLFCTVRTLKTAVKRAWLKKAFAYKFYVAKTCTVRMRAGRPAFASLLAVASRARAEAVSLRSFTLVFISHPTGAAGYNTSYQDEQQRSQRLHRRSLSRRQRFPGLSRRLLRRRRFVS